MLISKFSDVRAEQIIAKLKGLMFKIRVLATIIR